MLSEAELNQILNRPLTTNESQGLQRYLNLAAGHMSLLLCGGVEYGSNTVRTYEVREGYRTVFTGIVKGVTSVTLEGKTEPEPADSYTVRAGDAIVGNSWGSSIVFKKHLPRNVSTITVAAEQFGIGGESYPEEVGNMVAALFVKAAREGSQVGQRPVLEKRMEDYWVKYGADTIDSFTAQYASVIGKYGMCGNGAIRHGTVRPIPYN